MYGLVNKALEEHVVAKFGESHWAAIKAKAGVTISVFVSNEPYPEEITYNLVGAAAEVLDLPVRDILIGFGQHWVLKTGLEHYGGLMRSGGATLKEFLVNLQHFHTRVQLIYPQLRPPNFACSEVGDHSLRLHYMTNRPGLTDFVEGLLTGLCELYKTPARIRLIEAKAQGADHDVFEVNWSATNA